MQADSLAGAQAAATRVLSQIADDDALAGQVYRTNLRANMAGQLFVRDVELAPIALTLATGPRGETFLDLPFDEAIQDFEGRSILTADEFRALSDAERFRSFTVTRAMSDTIIDRVHGRLATAMQPGGPGLQDFIKQFRTAVDAADLPGGSRGYLENVYRTSTATSYNAGRLRQQTDPALAEAGLMWRYVTALDNRVRDEHAALHGKVWKIGDPEAEAVYPPNGYQCRCNMTVVESDSVDTAALAIQVPDNVAQEGFSGPPGEAIEASA